MDITYNDKVTVDGSSYIYSEGGEIVLNFGSITFKDLFNLEFDLQTNTTSSWNAPLEIEGISGFNIQNAGYSSYFTCIWGNTSHVMDTYPITSDEYVHYHIWQQNGSIFIQITQSNGVSYSYNATYNGSFSTIHLGNYHKENRATGVVKNVKFTTVNNYLDTIGLTSLWSKIKSLFATKTELGSKANDADVVHKSGDETISGVKNFNDVVVGEQSGVIRIGGNGEGALFCTLAYNGRIYNISKQFVPTTNNEYNLGTTSNKWKTLNGINPGALSFPSNNRIDILSTLQSGGYTAPSNGYVIAIKDVKTECASTFGIRNETIGIEDRRITERVFFIVVMVPVKTGEKVIISDDWNSIGGANVTYSASFYPCSGNV